MGTSTIEQLITVIEKPGCRKKVDTDLGGVDAGQMQGESSKIISGGDASLLVNYD